MAMNAREAALWWIERYHFLPVPVPWKKKGPVLTGWPELRLTSESDLSAYFNGERQNIAILMGEPNNLCDVDIDCPESSRAWKEYAVETGLRWGRRSNPNSHWLYFPDVPVSTYKYLDPAVSGDEGCMIELRALSQGGKTAFPVVAPPSMHPDDEPYEFDGNAGFPARTSGEDLERRVRRTGAASLLGRHAKDGLRHQIFIAVAGALARQHRQHEKEWPLADAQRFLRAVFRVIWPEGTDLAAANKEAESTYEHLERGGDTTGLRTLAGLIDKRVFDRLKQWLEIEGQEDWMHAQTPPKHQPHVLPEADVMENLRERTITMPAPLIEGLLQIPSITLMVSPGKVGKTVLAMQMLMSCANNLHLCDNYTVRGPVGGLIVEWDDQQAEASLKDFLLKCRASRPHQPIDYVLRPAEPFTISDPDFKPWLISQIRKRPAGLCVLDSYTALRGFGADDKTRNVVKLDADEITMLGNVAIETKCAIVLIHHDSKTASSLDIFSRAAGTFAIAACSETQIVLGRFPELPVNDPARLVSVRGRKLEGLQAVIRFQPASLDFDFILEGPAAQAYPELVSLLHAFRGKPTFDAKATYEEIGWCRAKAYNVLNQLTFHGILNKNPSDHTWSWNPGWTTILEQI